MNGSITQGLHVNTVLVPAGLSASRNRMMREAAARHGTDTLVAPAIVSLDERWGPAGRQWPLPARATNPLRALKAPPAPDPPPSRQTHLIAAHSCPAFPSSRSSATSTRQGQLFEYPRVELPLYHFLDHIPVSAQLIDTYLTRIPPYTYHFPGRSYPPSTVPLPSEIPESPRASASSYDDSHLPGNCSSSADRGVRI